MLYAVKTPKFLTFLFPNLIWEILDDKKTVYLTFDDGPTDKVTRKILSPKARKVKATFLWEKCRETSKSFYLYQRRRSCSRQSHQYTLKWMENQQKAIP